MTDRELLELAAKAAGWSCWQSKHGYLNVTDPHDNKHVCCRDWVPFDAYSGEKTNEPTLRDAVAELGWNPLIDDGDALRLAVKLQLDVCPYVYFNERCQLPAVSKLRKTADGSWLEEKVSRFPEYSESFVKHDPYAATRRAIVRAAAEIGKSMEVTK